MQSSESEEEEEYDFDKEFADDYDDESTYASIKPNDILTSNDEDIVHDEFKIVQNIDEIINVRVNNVLATANKNILNVELENMKKLNDFTFDQEIGYIVCSLLDSKIRAASNDGIIISYEYDSIVKRNLQELEKMIYVYNKITDSDKKIAIITDEQWEIEKNNYIKNIKDGFTYQVVEEPVEIYEESVKDDIIVNNAIELFGDIVEIN